MPQSLADTIQRANKVLLVDGNLDAVADFFAADYVAHGTLQKLSGGPDAIRRFLGVLLQAFGRVEVKVEILLEGTDRVAWQRTMRARHTGNFEGFPASGRQIIWRDMVTSRFEDGRIAEEWVMTDLAEQLLRGRKE